MKLYTVWCGEYSDRTLCAIFQSKEKAEKYVEVHDKLDSLYSDSHYISEYELMDDKFDINTEAHRFYYCTIQLQDYVAPSGVTMSKLGDIDTDEWWEEFMEEYGIKSFEDLKPEIYKDILVKQGRELEEEENLWNLPIEWHVDNRESSFEIIYYGDKSPSHITAYSQHSYAHARKIALDEFYKFKAEQEGLV